MKRALAVLVLLSWSALAAPLRFGAEAPVNAPEWDETPFFKWQPSIATDGKDYLAAWAGVNGNLFAARVAHGGPLLDPVNLFIGKGEHPAVVWTGNVYVIAWRAADHTLWATVVTREGEIAASKMISNERGGILRAATNGDSIAIVSRGFEPVVLLIDEALDVLARRLVQPSGRPVWGMDIAALGDDYLIATLSEAATWSAFTVPLTANGTVGTAMQVPNSGDARGVALASNGQNFLLAFDRLDDVNTLVLSPENQPLGNVRTVIAEVPRTNVVNYLVNVLSLVWRDGEYLLNYIFDNDSYQQKLLRLDANGAAIGSPSNTFARAQAGVAITSRPDGTGAALWFGGNTFFADGDFRSHVSFFDDVSLAAGAPFFSEITPARSAHAQFLPALESIEGSVAIAWTELSATKREIRLSYGGRTVVVTEPEVQAVEFIDVVWDGEEIYVFWQYEHHAVYFRRYTRELEAIDAEPELEPAVENAQTIDGIAGGGGEVLVIWKTSDAKRVARIVGGEPVMLTQDGFFHGDAKPVWDGTEFVVFMAVPVAPTQFPMEPAEATIVARRVSRAGVVSAPVTVYERAGAKIFGLTAAGNIVAWQELDGVRVARYDGTTLTNVRQLPWRTDDLQESLKVVALPDGGADVYWIVRSWEARVLTVEHRRLSADLQAGDLTTFGIDGPDFDATATGRTARIAYTRISPEDGYVHRIYVRSSEPAFKRRAVR